MKRVVIASGNFDPLHVGHLRYLEAARALGDFLLVIVNNDAQVFLKKGRPFMRERERLEVIRAVRWVDDAMLAVDEDRSVCVTLDAISSRLGRHRLIFANGGDVRSPEGCRESEACQCLGIETAFGVGGYDKVQSSSRLVGGRPGKE